MGVTGRVYIPLFCHHPGNSPVHRCPTGIKVLILMTLTILVFSGRWHLLAAASGVITVAAIIANLQVSALLRLLRFIFFYSIFIAAVRIIGKEKDAWLFEITETGWYVWKLAAVFTAGMVFFETTTGVSIHNLLTAFRTQLMRIIPVRIPDFPRAFSLMLLFIPRIFETWTTLSRAWDARGGNKKHSLVAGMRKLVHLVPLLVISLLDVAATTERAVRNRS